MDDETKGWLALALVQAGRPDGWLALVRRLGSAAAVASAGEEWLVGHGVLASVVAELREAWKSGAARAAEDCRRLGIAIAPHGSASYPEALAQIADPPLVLFWRGADPATLAPALAVVGARRCSGYGERAAFTAAREAARAGIVVGSGLARGIDAAAHRGALETGRTAAVLAGGLDQMYPPEHTRLAGRIVEAGGALMSEQPPGRRPLAWLFPFRNRIITGLATATLVVEARARSGSLASARHALDQGRELFAVPGPIDSPLSEGTNRLIAQGAGVYCRTADLEAVPGFRKFLEKYCTNKPKLRDIRKEEVGVEAAAILRVLGEEPATADAVAVATALDGTRVLALLTALELDGLIRREEHGRFRALARAL